MCLIERVNGCGGCEGCGGGVTLPCCGIKG